MVKTRRVAVVIDVSIPVRHHIEVIDGIHRYAREHPGWECSLQPFLTTVQKAQGKSGYHGIIARATAALAAQAAQAGVPLVNVWGGLPARTAPTVTPDWQACGRNAAQHLLQRGFRRFAFHGVLRHRGSQLALKGFKDGLRAANCGCTTLTVSASCDEAASSWSRYVQKLERWIGTWKPPLGIFAVQDFLGRHVINACLHAGLQIPEDAALVGLGNEPVACTISEPTLSSFDVGWDRVGYAAAALLDGLMAGRPAPNAPIFIEPTELVVRRSTDVCVVDNPLVADALRFIAEHSHQGIQVDDVAKYVHSTVRSLSRHFRAALGRTMKEEIGRLRLERAKRLLVESDESVKQVASDCGYDNISYFQTTFLRAERVTPGEYRRQRGGKGGRLK